MLLYSHLNKIMGRSDAVFAGSHYLVSYSQRYNSNVHLVPSAAATEVFRPLHRAPDTDAVITIGWLGGATKQILPSLRLLIDPLNHLNAKYKIRFKMVRALSKAVKAELRQNDFAVSFGLDGMIPVDQKLAQEIADFDIGVMPLVDEPFTRGKCAMKALEYMAMGIPVVASPVGENCYVVKPGINGFLAGTCTEWSNALEMLINDGSLRRAMGNRGREMVEEEYSVEKIVDRMVCAIEQLS
jgi:glycosyltransferase involved in cell wall biosynthesis